MDLGGESIPIYYIYSILRQVYSSVSPQSLEQQIPAPTPSRPGHYWGRWRVLRSKSRDDLKDDMQDAADLVRKFENDSIAIL